MVPTSVTVEPLIRLIFAVSRSATSAVLSGRNAMPHGTFKPVATVPATVTSTGSAVDAPPFGTLDGELAAGSLSSPLQAASEPRNATTARAAGALMRQR